MYEPFEMSVRPVADQPSEQTFSFPLLRKFWEFLYIFSFFPLSNKKKHWSISSNSNLNRLNVVDPYLFFLCPLLQQLTQHVAFYCNVNKAKEKAREDTGADANKWLYFYCEVNLSVCKCNSA